MIKNVTICSLALVFVVAGGALLAQSSGKEKSNSYRLVPPPAKFSPPSLKVDTAEYDWGVALQGETVEHTFTLTNVGGAPLIIERIKPSCGCTTVNLPEKPILPGQSDTFTLSIDTKSLPAKTKKSASIYSNDASSPAKVYMSGQVEPLFEVEPKLPKLVMVRGVEPEPLEITLTRSGTSTPLKVTGVTAKTALLAAKHDEVEPGQLYTIGVTAKVDEAARKYYYEQLEVTVEAKERTLTIPVRVSVTVKDRVDVEPRNSVYFNRTETKQLDTPGAAPLTKTLDIKSLGGEDHNFKITDIETQGQNFDTKLETVTEGKHYRLLISLAQIPAEATRRTINEKIFVKTDDPTVPQISVTALAAVK